MTTGRKWHEEIEAASDASATHLLRSYVVGRFAELLSVDAAQIDFGSRFADWGSDSLRAVEIKAEIERDLNVKLRSTVLFDHPTPEALCDHLLSILRAGRAPSSPAPAAAVTGAERPRVPASDEDDAIAIVGAACRLPGGVVDLEGYWQLLRDGRDAVNALDDRALGPRTGLRSVLGEMPAFAGLIEDPAGFDARLFRISPKEAIEMDPQQRILLQVCWEALEDAAISPRASSGRNVAVFVGTRGSEYHEGRRRGGDPAYQGTGASASSLAGRLSHAFGFTGPALAVDTACSASLVALHYAAEELRRGECSAAVVAGVNLLLSPLGMRATYAARMLAPDGRCKTFSKNANGYVRSEGCVALVLRRLRDAREAGEHVYGIVRGSAVNHDGATSGLTVPNPSAQRDVIRGALRRARLDAARVQYVECHGTGTELGDPIEVQALAEALGTSAREAPLPIGSVKSQIGHTEPVAGLASVLKVVLAMRHEVVPATLHCSDGLNQHVDWDALRVRPLMSPFPWPAVGGERAAGVSSFGFTGTNAHVVLSSPPDDVQSDEGRLRWGVLTLSAGTPEALDELTARWALWLQNRNENEIDPACRLSNVSRSALPYRRVWAHDDARLLAEALAPGAQQPTLRVSEASSPSVVVLGASPSAWARYALAFSNVWPAFARAFANRFGAVDAIADGALSEGREGSAERLHGLVTACALGDALRAMGLWVETWAGWGIGLAAANVLAGAPLEQAVAMLAAGGRVVRAPSLPVMDLDEDPDLVDRAAGNPSAVAISDRISSITASWTLEPRPESLMRLGARLYEAGISVDWTTVRPAAQPPQARLPSYPFELSTYWQPLDDSAPAGVTDTTRMAFEEVRPPALPDGHRALRFELSLERAPWLRDHQVEGVPIVPAAAILTLLRGVAVKVYGAENVVVRDLKLEKALVIDEGSGGVYLTVRPQADGGHAVELSTSMPNGNFIRHATAQVAPGGSAASAPAPPGLAAEATVMPPADLYALLRRAGIQHGAQFRTITALSHDVERAVTSVRVDVASEFAWGAIGLDACFISSATLLTAQGDENARVPVGCDEVAFFAPLESDLRATLRLDGREASQVRRADLEIRSGSGVLLARVRGLRLAARGRRADERPRAQAFHCEWTEGTLPFATIADAPAEFEIFSDDHAYGERLASVLRNVHGARVTVRERQEGNATAGSAPHHEARHVVWINRATPGPAFLRTMLGELPSLHGLPAGSRLWCITRGAFGPSTRGTEGFACLSRAVLWGLGRTLHHELPRARCTLVDFDPHLATEAEYELLASEFRRNASDAQVRFVSGNRQIARLGGPASLSFDPAARASLEREGTYIVTGGAGGLGGLAVRWLAECGAGHVVVASRRPGAVEDLRRALEPAGVRLTVCEVDVADRDALVGALNRLRAAGPPIRGIVHAAGIVQDATIERLNESDLARVHAPKVLGAWNLHELTETDPLDHFVVYSSLAGLVGSPGQAAYAGGNAFLDALVEARNGCGLPGVSLAWGPWASVGMAAGPGGPVERLAKLGIFALSEAEGLSFLDAALRSPAAGVQGVGTIEWSTYAAEIDPRLHALLPIGTTVAGHAGKLGAELRALSAERPDEVARRVDAYLRELVMSVAGSRTISDHDSFFELGLDSLQAVSMRNRVDRDLGIELTASVIFEYPTLATLREHLLTVHLGIATAQSGAPSPRDDDGHALSTYDAFGLLSEDPSGVASWIPADDESQVAELAARLQLLERELES